MSASTTVERAETYINVHLMHAAPAGLLRRVAPFITISRQSGTGGSALAAALVATLSPAPAAQPWLVYSGNLIEEVLRAQNLPPQFARFLPEDRIPNLDASVGELVGLHPDLWELVAKTNTLIRELARSGNVILVGRGANFVTADFAGGIHLRLVASESFRAACTAQRCSLSMAEAAARNAARDAARRRYVRANFDADINDPAAYTVLLNVERVPLATMVALIARLIASVRCPAPADA